MSFVESILLSFFQSGCFLFHFLAQLSWRNSSTMFNKCGERGHIFLLIDLRGNHLACVCMLKHLVVSDSLQPLDCSLPGSSVHGILQARILEWVAMTSSKGSSQPWDQTWFLHCRKILYFLRSKFFTPGKPTSSIFLSPSPPKKNKKQTTKTKTSFPSLLLGKSLSYWERTKYIYITKILRLTSSLLQSQYLLTTHFPLLYYVDALQDTWVRFLGSEDPLKKGMATHSSILAWRIPLDKGTWQATVHGIAKNRTQLSN